MKVFIDVGGHHGHSVLAALDPIFGFYRIFCFEPATACVEFIRRIIDKRVVLIQACLSDGYGKKTLYNSGTVAASVYQDAPEYGGRAAPETTLSLDAAEFIAAITDPTDDVWLKLNCEGSECDLLDSLTESGRIESFRNILIDFDAVKIPSQRGRVESTRAAVIAAGIPHCFPKQVQYGMINNYGGVRNWLMLTGAAEPSTGNRVLSAFYNFQIAVRRPELSGYLKMRLLKALPVLAVFARSRRVVR